MAALGPMIKEILKMIGSKYIWVTLFGGPLNKTNNQLIQIKIADCEYYENWEGKGPAYCYI